jgi:hypothetical protein
MKTEGSPAPFVNRATSDMPTKVTLRNSLRSNMARSPRRCSIATKAASIAAATA